jgi:hypothetical protein
MKYVIPLLLMTGCATTVKPSLAPRLANVNDCNRIYDKMIELAINNEIDTDHSMTLPQRAEAAKTVDKIYRLRGTTDVWFSSCVGLANSDQISCMSNASDVEGMSLCAKLFNHPSQFK